MTGEGKGLTLLESFTNIPERSIILLIFLEDHSFLTLVDYSADFIYLKGVFVTTGLVMHSFVALSSRPSILFDHFLTFLTCQCFFVLLQCYFIAMVFMAGDSLSLSWEVSKSG